MAHWGVHGVSEKGRCHLWLVRRVFVLFLIIILLSFMVFLLPLSGPFRDTSLGHYGGSLFIFQYLSVRYQPCDSHVDLPSFRLCPVFVIWASCHLRRLPCRSMLCIFKLCVGLATAGHPSVHSCSSPKQFTLSSFVRGLTDGCLAVKIRLLLLHCMLFFH